MARKREPPEGAEILYSRLERCELRDGLVFIEARSGAHVERGTLSVRLAMELHDALATALANLATVECLHCAERRKA